MSFVNVLYKKDYNLLEYYQICTEKPMYLYNLIERKLAYVSQNELNDVMKDIGFFNPLGSLSHHIDGNTFCHWLNYSQREVFHPDIIRCTMLRAARYNHPSSFYN